MQVQQAEIELHQKFIREIAEVMLTKLQDLASQCYKWDYH